MVLTKWYWQNGIRQNGISQNVSRQNGISQNVSRQNGIWQNGSWKCQNIIKDGICQNGNLPNGG